MPCAQFSALGKKKKQTGRQMIIWRAEGVDQGRADGVIEALAQLDLLGSLLLRMGQGSSQCQFEG